jgi:ech hydrogenase subunit A
MVIIIGFMSLLLPPFGAFIGKWLSIETLGNYATDARLLGAFTLVAVACGGALLTLLYFKVIGILINRSGEKDHIQFEKTGTIYAGTMYVLLALTGLTVLGLPLLLSGYFTPVASQLIQQPIVVGIEGWNMMIGTMQLPIVPLVIAFLLLPATIITALFIRFKNVDRAKEYMCGEKINYSFGSFYFSTEVATPYFYTIGVLFFIALIVVAVL